MIDISHVDELELTISADGKKLWINTSDGCKFRAYNIGRLIINDWRRSPQLAVGPGTADPPH